MIGIGRDLTAPPSHTTVHTVPYTAVRRVMLFSCQIRTRGKDMLQLSQLFFKSVAVTRAFRHSKRQVYATKPAKIRFKSHMAISSFNPRYSHRSSATGMFPFFQT